MKLTPWLVLISLALVSCSGSKTAPNVSEEAPQVELSDADDFIEEPAAATDEPIAADAASEQPVTTESVIEAGGEEPMVTETESEPLVDESPAALTNIPTNEPGTIKQYTVGKNETLMLIAFKLYGDYERWKELATQNRGDLKGATSLRAGMKLNYMAPAEEFVWNPQGLPYLIRTGDTLVGISKDVYATHKKWKLIWENNRPLIKDPNKIYAGFTIHYLENGREVANEL